MVLTLRLSVLYGLLPCTTLTDRFYYNRSGVFTARYALSPYIKQTSLVFKRLMKTMAGLT